MAIDDEDLKAHHDRVVDWMYDVPGGPSTTPLSDYLRLLSELFRARAHEGSTMRAYAAANDRYLGLRLDKEGRRDEAIEVLHEASVFYGRDDSMYSLILIDLAANQRDEERFHTALSHLDRAADVIAYQHAEGIPVPGEADTMLLSEYGAAYMPMGMPDVAGGYLRDAYDLAEATGDPWLWSGTVVFLMNLAIDKRDFDEVREVHAAYEEHPLRGRVPPLVQSMIRLRLGFGQVIEELYGEAEPGGAEATLRAVLAGPDVKPDEAVKGRLWLAMSLLDRGLHDEARTVLAEIDALLRAAGNEAGPHEVLFAALRTRLALDEGAPAPELARLLDEVMLPAYEVFLRMWGSSPVREGGVGYLQYGRHTRVIAELVELHVAVHGRERGPRLALEELLRAQALGTLARANEVPTPTLAEVEAGLLGEGRGILCFFAGRDGSHAFALDDEGCTRHDLAASRALEAEAEELVAAILGVLRRDEPGTRATLVAARRRASGLLLPPDVVERVGAWESVAVVGLDAFGYVPFEYLFAGDEAVGDAVAVSYLPSLPVGLWLARRERESAGEADAGVFLLGADGAVPPAADDALAGLASLPIGAEDLAVLAAPYEARGATVNARLGSASSPELLQSAVFERAVLGHFVGHGTYRSENERPAGLLAFPHLGAGGELTPDRVEGLRPPLVVVTACGAWKSRLRRGDDGRGHLGGAFLHAGARSVLLSYVDLHLEASLDLMGRFHEHVAAGEPLDRALLLARRDARPEALGVHPVHSYLTHVLGLPAPAFEPDPAFEPAPAGSPRPWILVLGLLPVAALAVYALRVRGRRARDGIRSRR